VDVCWRLRHQGEKLGFSPAAIVWHHRRNSLRAYWKQQQGYGKAEALLERKWPEKYNPIGHLAWSGRLYGNGIPWILHCRQERIYQGNWGSAPFQSIYQQTPGVLWSLPLMPEWYLVIITLAGLSALGVLWAPLLLTLPWLALAVIALLIQPVLTAAHASFTSATRPRIFWLKMRGIIAILCLLQPIARWWGRMRNGLTPWRRAGTAGLSFPRAKTFTVWSEHWRPSEAWLQSFEGTLRANGAIASRGGCYDRWDIEVRGGMFGTVRTLTAIEEHGAGRQLIRLRSWPRWSPAGVVVILLFAFLSTAAALDQSWFACVILGAITVLLALRTLQEHAMAMAAIVQALLQGWKGGA
jgi:O-antigen biosynthesis protein